MLSSKLIKKITYAFILIFLMGNAAIGQDFVKNIQNENRLYLDNVENYETISYIDIYSNSLRTFSKLAEVYNLIGEKQYLKAEKAIKKNLLINPEDLKTKLTQVILLYKKKQFNKVIMHSNSALEKNHELPIIILRGLANNALGNQEDALKDFKMVIGDENATFKDKYVSLNISTLIFLKNNFIREAINTLEKFPITTRDYQYYMFYGMASEGDDSLNHARSSYHLALSKAESKAEYSRAYLAIGAIYQKQAMPVKALKAYQSALEINSGDSALIRLVAHQYNNINQFDEAINMINKVLQNNNIIDLEFLANAQLANKDYIAAAKSYNKLLKNQTDVKAKYKTAILLGYSYKNANQLSEAIEVFQYAAELRDSAPTLYSLASVLENKGDFKKAIEIYRKIVIDNPNAEIYIKLSDLYVLTGDSANALKALDSAFLLGLPDSLKKNTYISQGALFYQHEQYQNAKVSFDKALALDSSDPEIFTWLSMTSIKLGHNDQALSYLKKILLFQESLTSSLKLIEIDKYNHRNLDQTRFYRYLAQLRGLNQKQRSLTLEHLGILYLEQGQHQLAIGYLRAASERSEGRWKLNRTLGVALARHERWNEALKQFEQALKHYNNPENHLNLARVNRMTNKPIVAIKNYKKALLLAGQNINKNATIPLLDELGDLYAEEKQNDKAQIVWKKSLALQNDPVVKMRAAMLEAIDKDYDDTLILLQKINSRRLTSEQNAERLDYLAQIYAQKNLIRYAIDAQLRALRLKETPERQNLLESYYQSEQRSDEALLPLGTTNARQLSNTKSLKNEITLDNKHEQIDQSLESLARADPNNLSLHKEIAFSKLKSSKNDESEYWFKRAIDIRLAQLNEKKQDEIEDDKELSLLRNEVSHLTNNFGMTSYYSYRSNNNTKNSAGIPNTLGGILPSQAGVEFSYRPPVIGLRNRRTFRLFGRMIWSMKSNSFSVDSDTYQGSLGVSYRPFMSHDFNISAERLFKIGKRAQNDWLIRGFYKWSDGYDFKPNRKHWNYTSLFTDLGYFVKSPGVISFYSEFRQGYSYNLWNLVLSPHAVIDGRIQSNDDRDLSYLAAGAGISFKYFFNQTQYTVPKSYFELLFQYKAGIININNGVNATGILHF